MGDERDTPDNTMELTSKNRLPHVVTLSTPVTNTTDKQNRDGEYTLSTEWDCPLDKLASYTGGIYWINWTLRSPAEYQVTKLPSNKDTNIHTVQVGCRKYAAKISSSPKDIAKEMQNHISVLWKMRLSWDVATRDFYELPDDDASQTSAKARHRPKLYDGPSMLSIPDFESEIIQRDHEGQDLATTGYVTEFIPPMHPVHVRALVDTSLDLNIRESVKNDSNLSNVRFRVHLGKTSTPEEATSTRLLSRPVYLDQLMREADGPLETWCEQMGIALAILHWDCRLDATGVKFYLAPDERKRVRLWMTNFGDCKPLQPGQDETQAMAKAVYNNSAWPRSPSSRNHAVLEQYDQAMCAYKSFTIAYALASERILAQDSTEYIKDYPIRFIRKLTHMTPAIDKFQDKLKAMNLNLWRKKET
ncbi:uncharacterized protein BKA55DRAFT_685927 [Fusarium redolens]|uniref:DUF3669 domain-containing protein n=1 Tax=Fusarium redolens TaxID=48865 RepID=A0A9P9HXQ8_FUSRE|nr:uncharacterized protein BKA55DRAFT_685927 [Fusarium redolens]KAH7265460.1 hypothetical protein BKA55DRAFT_685927 [Fusarium redolens]